MDAENQNCVEKNLEQKDENKKEEMAEWLKAADCKSVE